MTVDLDAITRRNLVSGGDRNVSVEAKSVVARVPEPAWTPIAFLEGA